MRARTKQEAETARLHSPPDGRISTHKREQQDPPSNPLLQHRLTHPLGDTVYQCPLPFTLKKTPVGIGQNPRDVSAQ